VAERWEEVTDMVGAHGFASSWEQIAAVMRPGKQNHGEGHAEV